MNISDSGIAFIKSREGCKLDAYLDSVGIPTIGYGHIHGVTMGLQITQETADQWLVDDLEPTMKCVNNSLRVSVTQNQFDALCSFVFNLGCNSLRNSTLLRLLNDGEDDKAAAEFGKWTHAGGQVIAGLVARREAEMELFLT